MSNDNLNRIIKISINELAKSATGVSINDCMIITSQQDGAVSSANRYKSYSSPTEVATDFGSYSATYSHADAFFSQNPNPVSKNGKLYIGYWRGASETVPASAGTLSSKQLDEITVISSIKSISDGEFDITIDGGTAINASALDFKNVISMSDIATILGNAITGATVVYNVNTLKFVITSSTTGATSIVSFVTDNATTGTYIGSLLGLENGSGAVKVDGLASSVLAPETKVDALNILIGTIGFKGGMFIDKPVDADVKLISTWTLTNNVLIYDVFSAAVNLDYDVDTNVCYFLKQAGEINYRCLFRNDADRTFASRYMARMHTVIFSQTGTAITMNLKSLVDIVAEDYSDDTQDKMENIGLDYYTNISSTENVISTGGNDYCDTVYNLLAIKQDLQLAYFNYLRNTTTKIGYDDPGLQGGISALESTSRTYQKANVLGLGLTWNASITFGDPIVFNNSITQNGFYWYNVPSSEVPEANRVARTAYPQGALKLDGAIQKADISIIVED